MYGTVARMRVKPGMEADFQRLAREMEEAFEPDGFITTYVYQMDKDSREFYLAVVFESREQYFANAESPEQHAQFLRLMTVLEQEPEWHDGEIVYSRLS